MTANSCVYNMGNNMGGENKVEAKCSHFSLNFFILSKFYNFIIVIFLYFILLF